MFFDGFDTILVVFDSSEVFFDMKLDLGAPTIFQEKAIPVTGKLAGWSALAHALAIAAPVRRPSCVSEQHIRGSHRKEGIWTIFDKRYWPGDTFADHLMFALRHEDIDLLILKRVFEAVPPARNRGHCPGRADGHSGAAGVVFL